VDIRRGIAEALEVGAALLVRQLAWGTSLTGRAVLASLDDDSPVRLTALATANGVSQPAMTQLVSPLEPEGLATRLIEPDDARLRCSRSPRPVAHYGPSYTIFRRPVSGTPEHLVARGRSRTGLAIRVALPLLR